jgi:hypothetical protein
MLGKCFVIWATLIQLPQHIWIIINVHLTSFFPRRWLSMLTMRVGTHTKCRYRVVSCVSVATGLGCWPWGQVVSTRGSSWGCSFPSDEMLLTRLPLPSTSFLVYDLVSLYHSTTHGSMQFKSSISILFPDFILLNTPFWTHRHRAPISMGNVQITI